MIATTPLDDDGLLLLMNLLALYGLVESFSVKQHFWRSVLWALIAVVVLAIGAVQLWLVITLGNMRLGFPLLVFLAPLIAFFSLLRWLWHLVRSCRNAGGDGSSI